LTRYDVTVGEKTLTALPKHTKSFVPYVTPASTPTPSGMPFRGRQPS
jgi:hypothetical protein